MTPETQLARALDSLADALLAEAPRRVRESLKHPRHADVLAPIRADAKAVLARFFKRQRALVARSLAPALRTLALREADIDVGKLTVSEFIYGGVKNLPSLSAREASDDAKAAVRVAVPDGAALPDVVTSAMSLDYTAALTAALAGGYDTLASDLASERTLSADVTAAYLRTRSLETLAAELEPTTVARLQTALADAYEAGEDFDGLVDAVRETFADMADARAGTVAQTAMNSAYNAGRKQLGLDLGFDEKSWSCDGPNPCEECLANQDDGWIPIEDAFSSGDDLPTLHPGCYCSLDVRASAGALAA